VTQAYIHGIDRPDGGSAHTNWNQYSLDQIWDMVSMENGRVTYTQVEAWGRMATLCNEQADQLETATRQLLQRWTPRPRSAAEAFSVEVTRLVASMRQAAAAAATNQQPLQNIAYTLASAQVEIAALLEARRQYALTEQQLTPQPTPSPGQTPLAAAPANAQAPPPNWSAQLEQQARDVMSHADTSVGTAAALIQPPEIYLFNPAMRNGKPFSPGDPDGPSSVGASGVSQPTLGGADWASSLGAAPALLAVDRGGIDIDSGAPVLADPVLSGGVVPFRPETEVSGTTSSIGGVQSGGSTGPVLPTFGAVMVPGGTIGARAPSPTTHAAVRGPNASGGSRAGTGVPSHAGGQAAMPMAPMVPPMGGRAHGGTSGVLSAGRPGRGAGRGRRQHTDPDDPWAVAEGGPAVLEPVPDPADHDPGPGVIGLDR
jgi:hypothetical protein